MLIFVETVSFHSLKYTLSYLPVSRWFCLDIVRLWTNAAYSFPLLVKESADRKLLKYPAFTLSGAAPLCANETFILTLVELYDAILAFSGGGWDFRCLDFKLLKMILSQL